ncbi:hypothetical protein L208DRAFT_1504828 [Tricholoma matsutake]|nr:hypothetical protein L208DRAFT_1504828 [Tricholoma matsutake 945]
MPALKKMKFLKNLKGWATVNSKKWKHKDLEEKENVPTCQSPKKAWSKLPNPNPANEFHNRSMPTLMKESKLWFECPGFKCKPGVRDCCCH